MRSSQQSQGGFRRGGGSTFDSSRRDGDPFGSRSTSSSSYSSSVTSLLSQKLQQVVEEVEVSFMEEKDRYENAIVTLHDKVGSLKATLDLEKARSIRQQELIDSLQQQLRDSQLVENIQSKERLLEQGKLVKEVEALRAEVMALRFQVLNATPVDPRGTDKSNIANKTSAVENDDPNTPTKLNGGKFGSNKTVSYSQQLLTAAREGKLETVKALLNPERAIVSSALEAYRRTLSAALSEAAGIRGRKAFDMVTLLLTCGADPFAVVDEKKGWNAVHYASAAGSDKSLEKMLSFGAKSLGEHLERVTLASAQTALHLAAQGGHAKCVRLLLRNGANATAKDNSGNTPQEIAKIAYTTTMEAKIAASQEPNLDMSADIEDEEDIDDDILDHDDDPGAPFAARKSPSSTDNERKTTDPDGLKARAAQGSSPIPTNSNASHVAVEKLLCDADMLFWSHSVRANRLYAQEDFKGALGAYSSAIELAETVKDNKVATSTNRATLYYNSARACVKAGLHLQAVERCTKAIDLKGGVYPNALAQRASSYMALFDYSHAVSDYEQLMQQSRSTATAAGTEDWTACLERARDLAAKATDHYLVLGLQADATPTQVKQSFRKQCLKWHPDKHRGTEDDMARASIMFKAINEANEVLSDEQKRTLYDIDRISKRMDDIVRRQHEEQTQWNATTEASSSYYSTSKRPRHNYSSKRNSPFTSSTTSGAGSGAASSGAGAEERGSNNSNSGASSYRDAEPSGFPESGFGRRSSVHSRTGMPGDIDHDLRGGFDGDEFDPEDVDDEDSGSSLGSTSDGSQPGRYADSDAAARRRQASRMQQDHADSFEVHLDEEDDDDSIHGMDAGDHVLSDDDEDEIFERDNSSGDRYFSTRNWRSAFGARRADFFFHMRGGTQPPSGSASTSSSARQEFKTPL
mmetsp:Transcript_19871/g.34780  ORF Transcript_19871/g.34780 Transcript_19871/m.34780 type:complete len:919 (-) Transcript_19871:115-2871(-)